MRWRVGERLVELVVQSRGPEGTVEVAVNGRSRTVRVVPAGPGRFVLEEGTRREVFHCVREGSVVHLFWRGAVHVFTEEGERARPAHRAEAGRLEAPMPGKVTAVKVAVGDRVTRGQELLVVEAMKMENALRAPRDGRVTAVNARLGEMVGPGVALVEIE